VWLPDAMAGPTPVSALIHAATMVTAGVYMICRLSFLYAATPTASAVVAWVGGGTALFAATIALVQTDIKKVLAYSTVSQLGYMVMAAGCLAYSAAIFHLVTHAFFKALLFLGAGSVILALHHEQDVRRMGGLRRSIPTTWLTFLVGVLAIGGFPLTSGFFSKEEAMHAAFTAHDVPGHAWLYAVSLATAGLTAFYMARLYFLVFHGESRVEPELRAKVHESPAVVTVPLVVLAVLSVFGGFIGLPQFWGDTLFAPLGIEDTNSLAGFLHESIVPAQQHAVSLGVNWALVGGAQAMFWGGLGLAWLLYVRAPQLPERIAAALRAPYRLLANKYWVDELYDAVVVRPLVAISDRVLFRGVDAGLIDGLAVDGTARAVRRLADRGLKHLQSGQAPAYLLLMVVGALAIVQLLLRGARG
jgi:NADH-quinone oxidoreductase subunit L